VVPHRPAPRYGTARCATSARDLLSDPRWKARIVEWIPPDIAEQVPLDLLGLITGLPAEMAQIPWPAREPRRTPRPVSRSLRSHGPGQAMETELCRKPTAPARSPCNREPGPVPGEGHQR